MRAAPSDEALTLSISVDARTHRILTEEAKADFGGDVAKLVAAIALEMGRKAAVDRIVEWAGYAKLSERERDEIAAGIKRELDAQTPRNKRPAPRRGCSTPARHG